MVRQAEADARTCSDRLTTEERDRLKVLERENRELRKANEILKELRTSTTADQHAGHARLGSRQG